MTSSYKAVLAPANPHVISLHHAWLQNCREHKWKLRQEEGGTNGLTRPAKTKSMFSKRLETSLSEDTQSKTTEALPRCCNLKTLAEQELNCLNSCVIALTACLHSREALLGAIANALVMSSLSRRLEPLTWQPLFTTVRLTIFLSQSAHQNPGDRRHKGTCTRQTMIDTGAPLPRKLSMANKLHKSIPPLLCRHLAYYGNRIKSKFLCSRITKYGPDPAANDCDFAHMPTYSVGATHLPKRTLRAKTHAETMQARTSHQPFLSNLQGTSAEAQAK